MQTDVGEFIAARSDRLLRTAYLLTGDREEAEHLLQAALAAVWSSWSRSDLGPDLTARRELVRGIGPWWRPRAAQPVDDEVLVALDRLPRRQRAALVLSEAEGLSEKELAEALDCSGLSAGRLVERARAAFGVVDAAAALESVADRVETDTTVAQRLGHVERRVGRRRRWRRAEVLATLGVAAVVAAVIFLLVPHGDGGSPSPSPTAAAAAGEDATVARGSAAAVGAARQRRRLPLRPQRRVRCPATGSFGSSSRRAGCPRPSRGSRRRRPTDRSR